MDYKENDMKNLKVSDNWKALLHEIYTLEEKEPEAIMYDLSADEMIEESPTGTLKGVSL